MKRIQIYDIYEIGKNNWVYKMKFQCSDCLSQNLKIMYTKDFPLQYFFCKFCRHLIRFDDKKITEEIEKQKKKMVKVKVEETIVIEEGKHEGEILDIRERTEPYHYIDFVVSVDEIKKQNGEPLSIKTGYSAFVSENSALGNFLSRMGMKLKTGKELELDTLLKRKVSYLTVNEVSKKDGNTYARIVKESIKSI